MRSLLRTFRKQPLSRMNGAAVSSQAVAAVTTDAQQTAVASIAAASKRLKELYQLLDTQGVRAAPEVGANLHVLAQQLQGLQHIAEAEHAANSLTGQAAAHTELTVSAQNISKTGSADATAAADVKALERNYAAPAAAGAAGCDEAAAMQPLTKKQRRAAGQKRVFDFSKFEQRSIVLQLMYVGWSYQGFARQADTDNTIEGVLFSTLRRVKLIPECAEISSLQYSRCGRTDRGVSALGQVLNIRLRSAALAGQPLPEPEQELDYVTVINRALPDTIRVLGWTDLPKPDFSARFSCNGREYKYFFVQDHPLNVPAMQEAATHLVGLHDFRHFCKADVLQVQNYMRRVLSVSLEPVASRCPSMSVLALHIKGTAFLWHQIRCIAAVLLMVGRGQEKPCIVQQLLDMQRVPCKPQYSMAAEEPLLLYRCSFDDVQQWRCSPAGLSRNLATVHAQLQQHLVEVALTNEIYEQLQQRWQQLHGGGSSSGSSVQGMLPEQQQQQHQQQQQQQQQQPGGDAQQGSRGSSRWVAPQAHHIPLLKRATEPSMEERFIKAGISLEVLNQPGGLAGFKGDDRC